MKIYAVIDTNVIVSAMLNEESVPGHLMRKVLQGNIVPLIHEDILREYKDVLSREKFQFDQDETDAVIAGLVNTAQYVHVDDVPTNMPDLDDAIFYATVIAFRGQAETYLVTGNKKHFPDEPFVVSPREMLEILNSRLTQEII